MSNTQNTTTTAPAATFKPPFKSEYPANSNGWATVLDADGVEIAVCYGGGKEKADFISACLSEHAALVAVADALASIEALAHDPAGRTFTIAELFGTAHHESEIEGRKAQVALADLAAIRDQK